MYRETEGPKLGRELLQVALGERQNLSHTPSAEAWEAAYRFAEEQAIVGVLWPAVEALRKQGKTDAEHLSMDLLMDWMGEANRLRERSSELDQLCGRVSRNFRAAGWKSIILKGQGNARLYADGMVRTPGDIDVWVLADREPVCQYLSDNILGYQPEKEGPLHTSFEWHTKGSSGATSVTVEVHFTATFLESPRRERQLQRWLEDEENKMKQGQSRRLETADGGEFTAPSDDFNLVYLMLHMYRHYLYEGIGLRHVVDYRLLWRQTSEEQHRKALHVLEQLGAGAFVRALEEPTSLRGRMLRRAIDEGGNFGKADIRNSQQYRQWGWRRLWRFASRNVGLIVTYPEEVAWHMLKKFKYLAK